MDDWQSEEELQAHFGEGGLVLAAARWIKTILEIGDLEAAWSKTDPNLRSFYVRAWLWENRNHPLIEPYDRDEAVQAMVDDEPAHPLWDRFAEIFVAEFRAAWDDFDLETWPVASRPRPTVLDHELVIFIRTEGEELVVTEPTVMERTHRVLMHSTPQGWLVAALERTDPPNPGWPSS